MSNSSEWEVKKSQIVQILETVANDTGTPRNIRRIVKQAAEMLSNEKFSPPVRAANAVEMIEEIMQDPNMPPLTRVQLWSAISLLEKLRA